MCIKSNYGSVRPVEWFLLLKEKAGINFQMKKHAFDNNSWMET